MTAVRHLLIDRRDLTNTRIESGVLDAIRDGEVLVRIDRVAVTANNVTYAAIAHLIPYFEFFPSPVDGFGRLPLWGFGEVVESSTADCAVGTRLFGFWPSSSHVVMNPRRVSGGTIVDDAEHRRALPAVYNSYSDTVQDPTYWIELEDMMCAFRPLFMTAFSIDELFGAESFMGASRIVVSSASSKTAWATGHMLGLRDGLEVVGLTSRGNVGFVEALDVYDRAVAYDDIATIGDGTPTAYVDYSGSEQVRRDVRSGIGADLVFDLGVGIADWSAVVPGDAWDEPPLTRYFAPSTIRDRMAAVGAENYLAQYGRAWASFVPAASALIQFEERPGIDALSEAYAETVAGHVSPNRGVIIRPGAGDRSDPNAQAP